MRNGSLFACPASFGPPAVPAFDAMSRFCGLASTTVRSLSGIPVPTNQSPATECGHKIFVPGDKLAAEVFDNLRKVGLFKHFQLSGTHSTFCVNYLIMAQAGLCLHDQGNCRHWMKEHFIVQLIIQVLGMIACDFHRSGNAK